VLLFGALVAVVSTAGGAYLCWENRHARVRLEAAGHVWTGHLYGVLLAGALLAAWAMFGLSCIALWRRERRERRAASQSLVESPVETAADASVAEPVVEQPRRAGWTRRSRPVLTSPLRR